MIFTWVGGNEGHILCGMFATMSLVGGMFVPYNGIIARSFEFNTQSFPSTSLDGVGIDLDRAMVSLHRFNDPSTNI